MVVTTASENRNLLLVSNPSEKSFHQRGFSFSTTASAQCAAIAYYKKLYQSSAHCYEKAFAENAQLLDDIVNLWRYNAACAASLAAVGTGLDTDGNVEDERKRLRLLAISWLQNELDFLAGRLDIQSDDSRRQSKRMLRYWLRDPDLSSIRDNKDSENISEDEMQLRERLWSDVNALLLRVSK